MKVVIAPDKFKGSLAAADVCNAVSKALKELDGNIETVNVPLADGGEGTFEILMQHFRVKARKVKVLNPVFKSIEASYGISEDGQTAFIEMARASGLQLLRTHERNPLLTSSYGTGELILDALNQSAKTVILGIGGSATNDAGMGMANALGYQFYDASGEVLTPIGKNLSHIAQIDKTEIHPRIASTKFIVLCDVTNPLFGEQGAAFVYGPQKGATPDSVLELDRGLKHFSEIVQKEFDTDVNFEGAGAAGGMGAGTKVFLHAILKRGIDYISEITLLEEKIKACDYVITGEGKLDEQTLSGKVVSKVVDMAKKFHKPISIICGQSRLNTKQLNALGVEHVIPLASTPEEMKESFSNPAETIRKRIHEKFTFTRH